jgi:hypothetical protein
MRWTRTTRLLLLAPTAVLAALTASCGGAPRTGPAAAPHALGAGFRYSAYGPDHDPGPDYWVRVGEEMAGRFPGAVPETVWIVGRLQGDGTLLNFPVDHGHELIQGSETDGNEAALDLFDRHGFRVWLQVEPGHAPVEELINLVMARYAHHPSVVGFGVDVEWFESTARPEGTPVSDEVAAAWVAAVRSHGAGYRLFLKHWDAGWMPPTVRDGLLFIDDSQILPSLAAMVDEFAEWGRTFAPAPVAFQFGYPSDRPWWRQLSDPPRDIGRAILERVPNTVGLYWVDFTVLDVFPPGAEPGAASSPAAAPATGYDPTPHPIVGVKIYDAEGDLEALFDAWRKLGITTVFTSAELAARDGFGELAARDGTDVFVIFPVLYAPEVLEEAPDLFAVTATGAAARDDWVEFACPSREEFRRRRVDEAVELVRRLRPAGLSLDFIRDFAYWEMVGPDDDPADLPDTCYCPVCLERFAATLSPPADLPVGDPAAAAAWIRSHAADQWVRFKTDAISSLAWDIIQAVRAVRTSIRVNLHTVPWRTGDFDHAITRIAGQDRATLGRLADYLSPMCYSFMLRRPPEWIASVVRDTAAVGDCPVLPSIQVAPHYRADATFSGEEFEACVRAALEPPSAGVVFWSWDDIAADPGRAAVIQKITRGLR